MTGRSRQPVEAVYATDGWRGPHARGRIVAFCEAPSVCIRTAAGEQVWWRADQTVPAAGPEYWDGDKMVERSAP